MTLTEVLSRPESGRRGFFPMVSVSHEEAAAAVKNMINKPPGGSTVEHYMANMIQGTWKYVPHLTQICFDVRRRLRDGGNRLTAQSLARVNLTFDVVTGVTEEDISNVVDQGARRSLADTLVISGFFQGIPDKQVRLATGVAHRLAQFEVSRNILLPNSVKITRPAMSEYVINNRELFMSSARFASRLGRRSACLIKASMLALYHAIFTRASSQTEAEKFLISLEDGDGLDKQSPIFVARERFIAANSVRRAHHLTERDRHLLMVKSWNAYWAGTPVKLIQLGKDEEVPDIYGFVFSDPCPLSLKHDRLMRDKIKNNVLGIGSDSSALVGAATASK